VALFAALAGCASPLAAAEPKVLAPSALPELVGKFASPARFGVSGAAILNGRVFVASNAGLLEIKDRQLAAIYQWDEKYNVVSRPLADKPRDALWLNHSSGGYLLRLERGTWHAVDYPKPPGGLIRGDLVKGFQFVSEPGELRMVGARNVWRWSAAGKWEMVPPPPLGKTSGAQGFASVGEAKVYVAAGDVLCLIQPCETTAHWLEAGKWKPPLRFAVGIPEQVIAAGDAVYVRGEQGELMRVTPTGATRMTTPGPCEAIVRSSSGKLIASFVGAGIFTLDADWAKLFDPPYPADKGRYYANLEEDAGVVVFTRSRLGEGPHGGDGLWISAGQTLERIALLK
jgi:hypothetical protein